MFKKKSKEINPGKVITPVDLRKPLEDYEIDAANILARHYKCDVEFIVPIDDYKRKTADILMQGAMWEIKTPEGASKYTIQKQIRRASKQAKNIVIDTRRTKLSDIRIEKDVQTEINRRHNIRKVILINKFDKIVEIQK
jgi:hypothetical protein